MAAESGARPVDGTAARAVGRRALLGAGGLAALAGGGALVLAPGGGAPGPPAPAVRPGDGSAVPFHGPHQAGILTPRQSHVRLTALDLLPGADRPRTADLLRAWSAAAGRLSRGRPDPGDAAPAGDPASLTVTFGFGSTLFDRLGLTADRPPALAPLPAFPGDELDPARGGGDLFVQIAADDPLVVVQALRTVRRLARGTAGTRWLMAGFTGGPGSATPRNLMGQPDGTGNPDPADPAQRSRILLSGPGTPAWLVGGSYAVVRRIRMLLDHWEGLPPEHREQAVGRRVADGAPLTGGTEHTPADLDAARPDGVPVIAANAHIRLAAPASNGGATMLRRSWSYFDGLRPDGAPDAGTLFVAWQNDPRSAFVPVQRHLARTDALSRYVVHESSAVFAVPGGAEPGDWVGRALFAP
ncbi:dye decolorizing peroxidase [Streptomyces sp. TLI_053]|uniref:Dyp-type peroxidase n=1 Tax=Streptomyces sp. TLI_053 TaxID=1855352 RepID=UPI00087B3D21|nr:Dyp-type peroxidase [Streptomyces sp. TLI_053]SDS83536.1 dye decolorizing peroxidase [Streptomyces sp. TLI_053]